MIKGKTVSVLIPSTPKDSLIDLLNSIKNQPYDELLIDVTPLLPEPKRNVLVKKSFGEILVLIDDDIYVPKNFLSQAVGQFVDADADYAQVKVVGSLENFEDRFISACVIFKREVLETYPWDEDTLFFNGDLMMNWVMQEEGKKYLFIDNVQVFHPQMGNFERLTHDNEITKKKFPKQWKELGRE